MPQQTPNDSLSALLDEAGWSRKACARALRKGAAALQALDGVALLKILAEVPPAGNDDGGDEGEPLRLDHRLHGHTRPAVGLLEQLSEREALSLGEGLQEFPGPHGPLIQTRLRLPDPHVTEHHRAGHRRGPNSETVPEAGVITRAELRVLEGAVGGGLAIPGPPALPA